MKYHYIHRTLLFLIVVDHSFIYTGAREIPITKQIKDKILQNYDKYEEPNGTNLGVSFYLHSFNIADYDQKDSLSLLVYVVIEWEDVRLKWNKTDFYNLTEINLNEEDVWIPELVPLADNRAPTLEFNVYETEKHIYHLTVKDSGHMSVLYSTKFETRCEINLKYWPNDVHTCLVKYGTYPETSYKIYGARLYNPFNRINQNWILKINKPFLTNTTKPYFEMVIVTELTFTRRSSVYKGMFSIPSLIIMVISLALFWLKPQNQNRIVIFGMILGIQFFSLQLFQYQITTDIGFTTPLIVDYLTNIEVTIILSILETIFLRVMLSLNSCPLWLYKVNCYISQIKILHNFNILKKSRSRLVESEEEETAQQAVESLNGVEIEKSKLLENTTMLIDIIFYYAVLLNFSILLFLHNFYY